MGDDQRLGDHPAVGSDLDLLGIQPLIRVGAFQGPSPKNDLQCQAWVYGDYPLHIPNNSDFIDDAGQREMVTAHGCTPISNADPQVAAYRKVAGTAPSTNPPTS
ncbi:MAG: hypothetical protein JO130_06200 [Solirubrobacterales bacterium]|nr:hypothetical protein [Solirubrobacterales bacterium]